MALAAILRFFGSDVHVLFNAHAATDEALAAGDLRAAWDDVFDCWVVPGETADRLVDLLEQLGYVYEIQPNGELTWSDEMFARTPRRMHDRLMYAVGLVLHPANGGDVDIFNELLRSWMALR